MKSLVIGSGAWGTVLANLLAGKNEVKIACHAKEIQDDINIQHFNSLYGLNSKPLSSRIKAFLMDDLEKELAGVELIVLATASNYYKTVLKRIVPFLTKDVFLISVTKGMDDSGNSILEIDKELIPTDFLKNNFALLSGPNLAKEIYLDKPAAAVVACLNARSGKRLQAVFSTETFRVYLSSDLEGVMYGGILKNVIAIAAGYLDAMDLGSNARSALLVRAVAEMKRYIILKGGKEETVYGLSGFGDLITTCSGSASRNYSVGYNLGKGKTLNAILGEMVAVAEGVRSCKLIYEDALKIKAEMPITAAVYKVLYQGASAQQTISELMQRSLKRED